MTLTVSPSGPVLSINAEVAPSFVAVNLGRIKSWNMVRGRDFELRLRFNKRRRCVMIR
jgi:hypothetical protein